MYKISEMIHRNIQYFFFVLRPKVYSAISSPLLHPLLRPHNASCVFVSNFLVKIRTFDSPGQAELRFILDAPPLRGYPVCSVEYTTIYLQCRTISIQQPKMYSARSSNARARSERQHNVIVETKTCRIWHRNSGVKHQHSATRFLRSTRVVCHCFNINKYI